MREKDPLRPPTPTWSWTAFEGPIDYLDTPPRWEVKWNSAITLTIAQNSTELTAPVMPLKVEGTHRGNSKHLQVIPDSVHPLRTHELSCVLVGYAKGDYEMGRSEDKEPQCYVIVVQRTSPQDGYPEYSRVGIAVVESRHITLSSNPIIARLV